jgi:hypothetical protein
MVESRKRAVLQANVLDFPSIAAGETAELTLTMDDARAGDVVALGPPGFLDVGLTATAYVNTANEVVVRLYNSTGAAIDPSAGAQAAVAAQGTLTMDTNPTDADTIVVGGITYTFLDSFVDAVDNVFKGATLAASKINLTAAINASGGTPGTTHFTSQVVNPTVTNATFTADTSVFTATVAGFAGNSIVTDSSGFTTGTNTFGATTLGDTTLGADAILVEDSYWTTALII